MKQKTFASKVTPVVTISVFVLVVIAFFDLVL